jgi:hypothetical protein
VVIAPYATGVSLPRLLSITAQPTMASPGSMPKIRIAHTPLRPQFSNGHTYHYTDYTTSASRSQLIFRILKKYFLFPLFLFKNIFTKGMDFFVGVWYNRMNLYTHTAKERFFRKMSIENEVNEIVTLPVLPLRGLVAFPAVQPQRVTQPVVLPLPQRSLRPAYARAS